MTRLRVAGRIGGMTGAYRRRIVLKLNRVVMQRADGDGVGQESQHQQRVKPRRTMLFGHQMIHGSPGSIEPDN